LPSGFNRLLLDNGLEVNDKNIIELAKAFVIITFADRPGFFPKITFLEGKKIKEYDQYWATQMDVKIKCRIEGGEIETWKFSLSKGQGRKGQFAAVSIFSGGKLIRDYQIKTFVREEGKRGELDLDPEVRIATRVGNATVEQDSFYYLITYSNGEQTGYSVCCSLFNFQANEENVYVRIRPKSPYTYGPNTLFGPVNINGNGKGSYLWQPSAEIQSGIGKVDAGNWTQEQGFQKRTLEEEDKNLTLEKADTCRFHSNYTDSFTVYYPDQFFQDLQQGANYPATFAGCVKTAAIEFREKQIYEFNYNKLLVRDYVVFKSLLTDEFKDSIL
jgi:hypothetical protein